jgi:hypothetical protein
VSQAQPMSSDAESPASDAQPTMAEANMTADAGALLSPEDAEAFRARWQEIQIGFVDEPRQAVGDADALVADVMRRLHELFAEQRAPLEQGWERGEDAATEDLRRALQRYRSFFERLLAS